jgi:predicted metal-dependent hydrolase
VIEKSLADGLALARAGRYFEAHEAFEDAWRAASPDERDFFQGLVHVVVAWYQDGRGNETGCGRQLEKAARRLAAYAPRHRGVDVASLLAQVERARPGAMPELELNVAEADGVEDAPQADVQPPLTVEEEEQPERNEDEPTHDA